MQLLAAPAANLPLGQTTRSLPAPHSYPGVQSPHTHSCGYEFQDLRAPMPDGGAVYLPAEQLRQIVAPFGPLGE